MNLIQGIELQIKKEGGRWFVNNKSFNEMTTTDREILAKFIKQFEEE